MKRMLSVLLALCVLAGMLPMALAEALVVEAIEENDAAEFALEADGLLVLSEDGDAEMPQEAGEGLLADLAFEAEDGGETPLADLDSEGASETSEPDGAFPAPSADDPGEAAFTTTIESDANSDELFAAYVNRIFYGGTLRRTMATSRAGDSLSGQDLNLYNALKAKVLEVAAGEEFSTEFTVPASVIFGGDTFTPEEYSAMFAGGWKGCNVNAWDFTKINQALWLDCTYEMYWFKRYPNNDGDDYFGISSLYYNEPMKLGDDGNYHLYPGLNYTFNFAVLDRYQAGANYTVNPNVIQAAQTAADNARAIVQKYAGYSDCAKLLGFAYEICNLVDYNDAATKDDWDGSVQDPWKLIWVFDGDSTTNVVCEGYSQAFQYLCELASFNGGIRCYLVTGDAGGNHAWNLVRMEDGKSYVVDVTWMDSPYSLNAPSGTLADWLNEEKGRLFLCGGTGSPTAGYKIYYRDGDTTTFRTYCIKNNKNPQTDSLNMYPASILTLAESKYVLNGWQSIAGEKYYFADGRYATGIREINGINYEFDSNGALLSSKVTGWREIDGTKVYFDENGRLHTGWLEDGGKRYYLDANGAMVTGWTTIDGERWLFEADGALHTVHTPVVDAAVAPTCEADGLTEGSHCAVCEAVITPQAVDPATGHSWGSASYTWDENNSSVTALHTCANDAKHVQTETVKTAAKVTKAATCEEKGETTYTAIFENAAFATQTRTVANVPATGHSWGSASYTWAEDNGSVTALRTCANDAGHVETETVDTTVDTVAPTCEAKGQTVYTARFENAAFAAQTRTAEGLPATGHSWGAATYTWAEDNGSVTALRTCANDAKHVQTETVKTTAAVTKAAACTLKGTTTYTAAFKNAAFAAQTKSVQDIPATGHSWGNVTYTWGKDYTSLTARRVCVHDAGHAQTETVAATAKVTKAATCTVEGQTTYTAAKFKNTAFAAKSVTVANLPAKGHTPVVDKAVAATYTKTGLTEGSHCSVCNAVLVAQKTVPKLDCSFHMKKSATKKVKAGVPIQIVVDSQTVKSYKSSDSKIAAVTSKGWVTTKMAGTAKITITLKNKKTLTLTVKVSDSNAPKSVKITNGSSAKLKAGKKLTLKTKLNPTKANTYLTWSTSDSKVATVSSKGVVTARKKGTAKITVATANGKKATIKITVK